MATFQRTKVFVRWLAGLRDRTARLRIETRLDRFARGNPGLAKSVGAGVMELKIDYGPGYRVYFTERGGEIVVLLCGGDKSSQTEDIKLAKVLASEWVEEGQDGA